MRPCSSWTKIAISFGSRQSASNVCRGCFFDRPGVFSIGNPSSSVFSAAATAGRKSPRILVRPPSICTQTRLPANSLPAGNLPSRHRISSSVRKANIPTAASVGDACDRLDVHLHPLTCEFLLRQLERWTQGRLPTHPTFQGGRTTLAKAKLCQFDVQPRHVFLPLPKPTGTRLTVQRSYPNQQAAQQTNSQRPISSAAKRKAIVLPRSLTSFLEPSLLHRRRD